MPANAKPAAKSAAKRVAKPAAKSASRPKADARLGALPEWNLNDLYAGIDDPALKRDLEQSDADCVAFENDFKGKLAALAAGQGGTLVDAVRRYEAIEDRLGRVYSYASLLYAGDNSDPARAKFYGDVQERGSPL
jgi:oligoendopeptidase F